MVQPALPFCPVGIYSSSGGSAFERAVCACRSCISVRIVFRFWSLTLSVAIFYGSDGSGSWPVVNSSEFDVLPVISSTSTSVKLPFVRRAGT